MKNVLKLNFQLTNTDLYFCYGHKSYNKTLSKVFSVNDTITKDGITTILTNEKGAYSIVIGVSNVITDPIQFNGLLIHELNHCITAIMDDYNFKCDEVRSCSIQWLYQEIAYFLNR